MWQQQQQQIRLGLHPLHARDDGGAWAAAVEAVTGC